MDAHRGERIERATEREIIARLDPGPVSEPIATAVIVSTIDLGNYPTTSPAVFACDLGEVTFDETEGGSVDGPFGDGSTIYVYNVTSIVPPIGAVWIAVPGEGGKYCMAYTGPKKT